MPTMIDPFAEYVSLIHQRQQNPLSEDQYGEKHHIIPRSCGGPDLDWNIVKLTPAEHYRCHCLLPKIYTEGQEHRSMVVAALLMSTSRKGEFVSEEEYAGLKLEFATWNKGKSIPSDVREKMSRAHKGRATWSKGKHLSIETRRKMSLAKKGKPSGRRGAVLSMETRNKIRASVNKYLAHKQLQSS